MQERVLKAKGQRLGCYPCNLSNPWLILNNDIKTYLYTNRGSFEVTGRRGAYRPVSSNHNHAISHCYISHSQLHGLSHQYVLLGQVIDAHEYHSRQAKL